MTGKKKIGFSDPELDAVYQRAFKSIKKSGTHYNIDRHSNGNEKPPKPILGDPVVDSIIREIRRRGLVTEKMVKSVL